MEPQKTYLAFGPRVSAATKQTLKDQLGCEEIPMDFGPFGSGAAFCELFPYLKADREGKSDDQMLARYKEKLTELKGSHVIFVESTGEMPNVAESVERVRFAVNSFKHYGAAQVTVAMPNIAYDRQDRGFNEHGRLCSLGSKWLATDLKRYEADRIVTFAPHSLANIKDWRDAFGERNYIHLSTTEMFAEHIRAQFPDTANVVIGAPDGADKESDQGQTRARELVAAVHGAAANADSHLFKIGKGHVGSSDTIVKSFEGDVAGKDCILIDDMSDGGSTLIKAAIKLREHGAKTVTAYCTHAICSESTTEKKPILASLSRQLAKLNIPFLGDILKAYTAPSGLEKLLNSPDASGKPAIDHLVLTDTVPEIVAKREALEPALRDRVEVLSIGPQLAQSLQKIIQEQSTFAARFGEHSNARIQGH